MMESHFREVMIVLCSLESAKKARKDSIGAAGAWSPGNLAGIEKNQGARGCRRDLLENRPSDLTA
jgi:hypothetical protein